MVNDHLPVQQQNQEGEPQQVHRRIQDQRNLGAQHHALLHFRDTTLTVDYVRPNFFQLRIVILLICFAITSILLAVAAFFIPGWFYFYLSLVKFIKFASIFCSYHWTYITLEVCAN